MRLGQLIINAALNRAEGPCPSVFYIEDHTLIAKLQEEPHMSDSHVPIDADEVYWEVEVIDHGDVGHKGPIGGGPMIQLQWGWTAGMTADQLKYVADDAPTGYDHMNITLEGAKRLREKLDILIRRHKANHQSKFFLFFGGPFSQWYPSVFQIYGITYNCAEQWMMACKARMFGDTEAEKSIMETDQPSKQKAIGRKVKGFNQATWEKEARDLVKQGSRAKFDQNYELKRTLMETGDKPLVEASPTDVIWGIGLAEDDPKAMDKSSWRGTNWLGEILTELREEYKG